MSRFARVAVVVVMADTAVGIPACSSDDGERSIRACLDDMVEVPNGIDYARPDVDEEFDRQGESFDDLPDDFGTLSEADRQDVIERLDPEAYAYLEDRLRP